MDTGITRELKFWLTAKQERIKQAYAKKEAVRQAKLEKKEAVRAEKMRKKEAVRKAKSKKQEAARQKKLHKKEMALQKKLEKIQETRISNDNALLEPQASDNVSRGALSARELRELRADEQLKRIQQSLDKTNKDLIESDSLGFEREQKMQQ